MRGMKGRRHHNLMLEKTANGKDLIKWLLEYPDKMFLAREWHEKRSLSANAYFHVLSDKIADARTLRGDTITKTAEKNELIGKYGQRMLLPNGNRAVFKSNVPPEVAKEWDGEHLLFIKHGDEPDIFWYCLMRHTATYDSREMAALIDGTVEDAKEWGVETLTPAELERLRGYGRDLEKG